MTERYERYCDLVCEGGGVKGIGLAGAYSVLEEYGYQPQNVAGTSAGAITAALIAAGYSADELKEIVFGMNFLEFRDRAWEDQLPLAGRSVSILKDLGVYEGKFFESWIRGLLAGKGVTTFADLVSDEYGDDPRYRFRLQVIASDVTTHRLLVLPRDAGELGFEPEELDVASAVRMSMSIPIFFEPSCITNEKTGREHVIVDGGMLSNYPVWLYDSEGGPRLADVRPPARRAGSEDADRRAPAEAGAGASRPRRPDQVHAGNGARDDGGSRPALHRQSRLRPYDPDSYPRRRDDGVSPSRSSGRRRSTSPDGTPPRRSWTTGASRATSPSSARARSTIVAGRSPRRYSKRRWAREHESATQGNHPETATKAEAEQDRSALIAGVEGFRSDLYDDAAGHCTIGYGHLVHRGRRNGSEPAEFRRGITQERALELLLEDAAAAAEAVNRSVKVTLNQHQFDALVSFVFNVGTGAFGSSTLLRKLNEGRYDAVPGQLDRWVRAGGRRLEGLARRRKAEAALFLEGEPPGPDGGMTTREVQQRLRKIGWPLGVDGAWGRDTFAAVRDFQRGFAFWRLLVDGHAGVKTQEALRKSVELGGKCSPHFSFEEFRSKGNGWIKVSRELVLGLEEYRQLVGGSVEVICGYRDPQRNASIPGASKNSQHLYGNAADIEPLKSVPELKRLRRFSGLGYQGSSGLVRHVDVRHVGPNTTGNSVRDPATWVY